MANGPTTICIDSEDEAAPTPSASLRLLCQMMIPCKGQKSTQKLTVGDVTISQRSQSRNEVGRPASTELEFQLTSSEAARSAIVPTKVISHMTVNAQGQMITLKLQESINCELVAPEEETLLSEFALVPREAEVHKVLSALRWWLPHVVVQGALPPQLSTDGAVLRLEGLTLTARDMKLLEDEQCLNDSVLDFFLRLALDVVAPDSLKGDLYVASTFFFQKLTSGGVENGEQGWNNVRRWTRSLPGGLLGQRYVIVPINEQNIHWWLAVVCHARRALDDGDREASQGEMPRIVCLDSAVDPPLKGRVMAFLRGYLWKEWCERHGGADSIAGGLPQKVEKVCDQLKVVEADVPKQANSFDCGIFIIEYLLHLLQSKTALAGLGLAAHKHWFGQASVSHRRKRLKWLAALLQAEAQRRSQPDVSKLMEDQRVRDAVANALTDRPKKVPKGQMLASSRAKRSSEAEAFQRRTRQRAASRSAQSLAS